MYGGGTKGRAAGPVFVPSPVVLSGSHTRSTMLGMHRGSWGIRSENRRSRVVESFHNREGMPKSSASLGFGVVTCVNLSFELVGIDIVIGRGDAT